jgi:hypothetical protein
MNIYTEYSEYLFLLFALSVAMTIQRCLRQERLLHRSKNARRLSTSSDVVERDEHKKSQVPRK